MGIRPAGGGDPWSGAHPDHLLDRGAQGPKDDPDDVAADAYDALMAGKDRVVAGSRRNWVQAELSSHLPDVVTAPLMATLTKPRH